MPTCRCCCCQTSTTQHYYNKEQHQREGVVGRVSHGTLLKGRQTKDIISTGTTRSQNCRRLFGRTTTGAVGALPLCLLLILPTCLVFSFDTTAFSFDAIKLRPLPATTLTRETWLSRSRRSTSSRKTSGTTSTIPEQHRPHAVSETLLFMTSSSSSSTPQSPNDLVTASIIMTQDTNELEDDGDGEIKDMETFTSPILETSSSPPPPVATVAGRIQTNVFLGIEPTPEILAIVFIYFVQGALGLARLAQTYLLKDELSLGPAELSALSGIFTLPWTIKPLYGFLSDGFPLFRYQRKSYLVLAGILGGLSYTVLGMDALWESLDKGTAVAGTVGALMLSSACIAFSDVVADGIVVKRTRESAAIDPSLAGGLQSLCWGASAFGGLLSAYFSGSLLEIMSVRDVFGVAAVLPFLVSVIALGMEEKQLTKDFSLDSSLIDGVKDQINTLWETLKQPSIWRPALFLFLWQSTPTSDGAFFFFLTNDLKLAPEFLGRVRLVDAIAGIFGVWLYQKYLRTAKIKDILYWSTIASFPLGLLPILLITHTNRLIGIPDTALIFGDDVVLTALGQISFLPILVLAARLCPPGVEAVLFATLMSIFNGASTVGTEVGAALTKVAGVTESNFDNLPWLTAFCSVTSLYPLLFMNWLDGVGDVSEEEIDQTDTEGDETAVDSKIVENYK